MSKSKIAAALMAASLSTAALADHGYQLSWSDSKAASGASISKLTVQNLTNQKACAFARVFPAELGSGLMIMEHGWQIVVESLDAPVEAQGEVEFDLAKLNLVIGDSYVVGYGAQPCPVEHSGNLKDGAVVAIKHFRIN
jgi:hypothetical protein